MKSSNVLRALTYTVLILGAASMIIPFLWMLSTALKTDAATFVLPPEIIPKNITLHNFIKVSQLMPVFRFFMNSLGVALTITVGQLIICSMGGFAFARIDFKGRNLIFLLYLGTLMVPSQVTLTPLFILMKYLGWINTYKALIIPSMFKIAFGTFLMKQFFMNVPKSIEEAAFLDGVGYFRLFKSIFVPLAKPALATLSIFSFMESWNNFLWPLIVTNDTLHMTLPLGLSVLQGRWETNWNLLMAGTVINVLPILIVYIFAQKYFIEGLTHTGIK